jgi:hypothetical protein
MADTGTLHDAFIDDLRDAYDAEKQLTKALPKMAKAASSPDLRKAFETHLEETRGQVDRLEQVFASLDEKVRGKHQVRRSRRAVFLRRVGRAFRAAHRQRRRECHEAITGAGGCHGRVSFRAATTSASVSRRAGAA